ncbi:MAG: OmpA family protein [Micrococcales bacterium]|nr:OmpA family protein [Micrococcales bacterium]
MAGRDEKRFPAWAPWAAGLVGGGLLVGAQLVLVRSNVEDDLTTRAKNLLAQLEQDDPEAYAGYGDFDVTFHGRDAVVSGVPAGEDVSEASAGSGVDETLVKLNIGQLEGVRTVTVVPAEEEAEEEVSSDDASSDDASSDEAPSDDVSPDGATEEPAAGEPAAPATPEPTTAPTTADGVAAQVAQLPQIPFVAGTARWDDGGNAILAQMTRAILRGPADATYEIQGHTDSTGDPDANLALSQRRAEAVRAELINRAVPAGRLTAVGYGQTKPLVSPEATDDDRAANRRVVLVVTGG